MSYNFLIASTKMVKPPKETYLEDFKARLIDGFENSSDWFTIQEEYPFASEEYIDIDARINYVIANETGEKMSDDYKLLWFKDVTHEVQLGTFFYFNENYWIVINTEKVKSLANSVTVKRCNNTLRWVDSVGGYYSCPCTTADALIRENRDYATTGSAVVNISGVIEITTQFNERTNTIKANQRFLFGNPQNWTCYKIFGAGVNNINLMQTEDLYSAGLIRYSMGGSQYNENSDDLELGIADSKQYIYSINVNPSELIMNIGKTIKVVPQVILNGKSVTRDLVWTSSNPLIAEVYDDGTINPKQRGNCEILVELNNNPNVHASISIQVVDEPFVNWEIRIYPNSNYVLENDKKTFEVYLYENNMLRQDVFTFSVSGSLVPSSSYIFTVIDGNRFSIDNLEMFLDSPLLIDCNSGIYNKQLSILLKGGW